MHRLRTFDRGRDSTLGGGLPVTTPVRAIYDLAPGATPHRVERLCHRAEYLGLLDVRALRALPPRRSLTAALNTLTDTGPQITRSDLEERFLELVAQAGLPRPLVNATVAGLEGDFYLPQLQLVVETDGAAAHLTPRAFERDHERDELLGRAGLPPLRLTHRRITREPATVIATLRQLAS